MERTRKRPIAERLLAILLPARVPLVDDELHRHPATPQACPTLRLVGPGIQPAVAALAIDGKLWRYPAPWRRILLPSAAVFFYMKLAHFVKLGRLGSGISHKDTPPAHFVPGLKLVVGVSALTDSHQELSFFPANEASQAQHVTEVAMAEWSKDRISRMRGCTERITPSQEVLPAPGTALLCPRIEVIDCSLWASAALPAPERSARDAWLCRTQSAPTLP